MDPKQARALATLAYLTADDRTARTLDHVRACVYVCVGVYVCVWVGALCLLFNAIFLSLTCPLPPPNTHTCVCTNAQVAYWGSSLDNNTSIARLSEKWLKNRAFDSVLNLLSEQESQVTVADVKRVCHSPTHKHTHTQKHTHTYIHTSVC